MIERLWIRSISGRNTKCLYFNMYFYIKFTKNGVLIDSKHVQQDFLSVVDLSVWLSVPLGPFSGQPYSGQRVEGVRPMFSAQRHLSLIFQNFKISFGNSSWIEILGISVGSKMAFWAKPSGPPSAVSQPPTSLPNHPIQLFWTNSTKFFYCFHKNLRYSDFNPKYNTKQRFNE